MVQHYYYITLTFDIIPIDYKFINNKILDEVRKWKQYHINSRPLFIILCRTLLICFKNLKWYIFSLIIFFFLCYWFLNMF